jgi:hypothetical protein
MGRKPWTMRLTVEECPVQLSIKGLARDGVLEFDYPGSSSYSAILNDVEIARFQFQRYDNISGYSLYFPPQAFWPSEPDVQSAGQAIYLCGSRCIGQGRRFWFTCVCRRSAGILYLPPGTAEFRCRLCYNLTYRSCQRSKPHGWVSSRRKQATPTTWQRVWAPGSRPLIERRRGSYRHGMRNFARPDSPSREETEKILDDLMN